VRLLPY